MSDHFIPQEIIRHKRDGKILSHEEIEFFTKGLTDETISREQVSAFAMAVFFQGMNDDETTTLTKAFMKSGDMMDWSALGVEGPLVEKHSTGGVGDKITLLVAPIVAACGVKVPTISGRGLGHSTGTVDKMESIPGYSTVPDMDKFVDIINEVGCSIIGQTASLAPADKRMYHIRDVTATVECDPLIVASILSKKLAAGADGLVMDVKFGSGAFMDTYDKAKKLMENLVDVANKAGLPTSAIISDMNQVLGYSCGNGLEVRDAVDYLTGTLRCPRMHEVTMTLATEMMLIVGAEKDADVARAKAEKALSSGHAAELFSKMIAAHGGPPDFIDDINKYLKASPVVRDISADRSGYISSIHARGIGLEIVSLGGGRTRPDDKIDYSVGFMHCLGLGEKVAVGDRLCQVHALSEDAAEEAERAIKQLYSIGDEEVPKTPVIYDIKRP